MQRELIVGCVEGVDERRPTKEELEGTIDINCWKPMYPGDSRKWLLTDPMVRPTDPPNCSTMKDTYRYPVSTEEQYPVLTTHGKRTDILRRKLLEEVVNELEEEKNKKHDVEDYCTEYDGNYNAAGWIVKEEEERKPDPELCDKYPVYRSQYVTYYSHKWANKIPQLTSIRGLTKVLDLKNPFRRHSGFSQACVMGLDEADN